MVDRVHPLPPPPPLSADDAARVDAVLRALDRLRRIDPTPQSQGLSPAGARAARDAAISAITRDGLARELGTPGRRPASVAVVVAYGVFTSPLEWAALFSAAGCRVHLKAPSRDPAFCRVLAEVLAAENLPVTAGTDRELSGYEAVVAFGDDASVEAVARATPQARHSLYGHRFSVAWIDDPLFAQAVAYDHALYDTRGCMAPVAVFTRGDPETVAEALAEAMDSMQNALPRGRVDPALGPEWRRRVGLARIRGSVREGEDWAVLVLPPESFTPASLPRMAVVHPVGEAGPDEILAPWRGRLSSLATEKIGLDLPLFKWFPRICIPGTLQRPDFPRLHDGRPMLGSVVEPD